MTLWNLKVEEVNKDIDDLGELKSFLANHHLLLEQDIDKTIVVRKEDKLVGTGSVSGNVLKSIAVATEFQGEGVLTLIINTLKNYIFNKNYYNVFVYTTREQVPKFKSLGFKEIEGVNDYPVLLEDSIDGIKKHLINIRKKVSSHLRKLQFAELEDLLIAALVMNCNPITNGHLYLIKKAAANNNFVIIFILSEDLSAIPTDIRYNLVRNATSNLNNVLVLKGGNYILSYATFPSYFIGINEGIEKIELFSRLDVQIFSKYITPILNIKRRYVGDEPYCQVTAKYNQVLQEILPRYNIDLIKVKRMEYNNKPISASRVRQFASQGKWDKIKPLVPDKTYKFLRSSSGRKIIGDM